MHNLNTMTQLPTAGDLEATWSFIEPGLAFILGAQGDQGVTSAMYMNCYTAVYNYCTNKLATLSVTKGETYSLTGEEIYRRLRRYLQDFVVEMAPHEGEAFLPFYVRRWRRYTVGASYLNNVFDYMNRYWVQKERSDGRRDVYDVNTLALIMWRDYMFTRNAKRVVDELLDLVARQRDNDIVDTSVISTAVKSMVYIGIDPNDLKKSNMSVYTKHFEERYLVETKEYFARDLAAFLAQHLVVDYMEKSERRLSEEVSRLNQYLEERTRRSLLETLHNVLIKTYCQQMYGEFVTLLETGQTAQVERMYRLLAKVPSTLQPLADSFELYIKGKALKALEELRSEHSEEEKKKGGIAPKAYIHALIAVYNEYNEIALSAFKKDPLYIKALDGACRHFVNTNCIATPNPKLLSKTPELLARYADGFLKALSKEADVANMTVDNLVLVLRYTENKDVFENHYRRLLAKRLINGNTKSDELEESVLQRLQEGNLMEFTSKISKMFQDMKSLEDLKGAVRTLLPTSSDFSPLILAQSMWPFTHSDDYTLTIHPSLSPALKVVEDEYMRRHTGRQLKWLWNHGKCEVKANLSRKGKPPFIFTVTNVQLMILLAFNANNTKSFERLHKEVGVARHVFEAHLLPLTRFKLLEQSPPEADAFAKNGTKFTLVSEYKSKKLKVNFVTTIRNELRQEEDETSREIEELRKNYLTASIVRIMKARRTVKHNVLLNEVMLQAQLRFKAKLIDMKRAIEYLLEKEYIRRVENDLYEYLA